MNLNKLISAFLLIVFMLAYTSVYAQYPSDNGVFEVNVLQGCAGVLVEITDPCANCADYDFNNDNDGDGTSFVYDEAGIYRIEALAAGGNVTDVVTITVYEDSIPQADIYRCGNRSIELSINDDIYDSYLIDWGDGNQTTISGSDTEELYQYATTGSKTVTVTGLYDNGAGNCSPNVINVPDVANLPTATINEIGPVNNDTDKVYILYNAPPNALYRLQIGINGTNFIPAQTIDALQDSIVVSSLLLEDNYYCFRISTLNACQPGNPPEAYGPVICTANFSVNFTGNEENILNWATSSTGITGYSVIKESNSNSQIQLNDANRRSYTDQDVTCNQDYCYTLITKYAGGAISRSLQYCGTARLNVTPQAVDNFITQVSDNSIQVSWDAPTTSVVQYYNLFRSANGGVFDVAATEIQQNNYNDQGLSPAENTYCYQVTYRDRCENISNESREVCAIRLQGNTRGLELIELRWNAYNGYASGVQEYVVDKFNSAGIVLASNIVTGTSFNDAVTIDDPQELHYRITAIPVAGNYSPSYSNTLIIVREARLNIPNAFIPGSGGENATFKVITPFLDGLDLKIFNRWGNLVYETTDPNTGWNGNDFNGNPLPQDTYVYNAQITFESGRQTEASGTVILLRR